MFLGGWLYPDAPSTGVVGAGAAFRKDGFDGSAKGMNVTQAMNAPPQRQFKTFWTDINSLSGKLRIDMIIFPSFAWDNWSSLEGSAPIINTGTLWSEPHG